MEHVKTVMPQRFIPPRDAYELRLSRIWADTLRRDALEIGMKDDFFALGGDRARAEAVLAAASAQFDAPLSMEAFLEEPTIERMGCLLRARSTRLNEQPVVPLQPRGSKRPFFFLAQSALMTPGPHLPALRGFFAELLTVPEARRFVARRVQGLDNRYGDDPNPLVGRWMPAPIDLRRGHFVLLLPPSLPFENEWGERLEVRPGEQPLLIRPDGFVAWVGDGDIRAVARPRLNRWSESACDG